MCDRSDSPHRRRGHRGLGTVMADKQTELVSEQLDLLVDYALDKDLITQADRVWAINSLLDVLGRDTYIPRARREHVSALAPTGEEPAELVGILEKLTDDAVAREVVEQDSVVYRDLFDTALMGALTPAPREVHAKFSALYKEDPALATDWYYGLSKDTNYIRVDRMVKDIAWKSDTEYGPLDVTINLAKPEKDPRAIAAARNLPAAEYPLCLLCSENEGYAGRVNHPARQNHRTVPVTINESPWFIQFSPYVYYNEHCIVFNDEHTPMKIDAAAFGKLLDFVGQFPHYFVGSNADLPIVGGSILAHDHFQGGRYTFAMEEAPVIKPVSFSGFEDVEAGIVKWPLSVLRLRGADPKRLVELADTVLGHWREYTDEDAFVFAHTDGEPHNTITPIARRRGEDFELDLVLRNNITTEEHPLGVYHPHAELHHIKKENIGLIEVMGLAVLPSRLKEELAAVGEALLAGADLSADPLTAEHAQWAAGFADEVTEENVDEVIQREVGDVFAQVLEHAGVYKQDEDGLAGFTRFTDAVNASLAEQ